MQEGSLYNTFYAKLPMKLFSPFAAHLAELLTLSVSNGKILEDSKYTEAHSRICENYEPVKLF
jgi:hypothetical protein